MLKRVQTTLLAFGLVLVVMDRTANCAAIAPNAFIDMSGSTVSSPITFESFLAPALPIATYTSVQFLLTISDECNGCAGTIDTAELYYGSGLALKSSGIGTVVPFATPCTFDVTIGPATPYPSVTCALSPDEGNPNLAGSFANDIKNGGVWIVAACVESNVTSYTAGKCASNTNLNDKFFYTGSAGDASSAALTLQTQDTAATPEPGTILFGLIGTAAIATIRFRN